MCDCYYARCAGCNAVWVSLHIGDYTAERSDVDAYCPECVKLLLPSRDSGLRCARVFVDAVTSPRQVCCVDGTKDYFIGDPTAEIGDIVVIICRDEHGDDIHLN